MSSAPTPFSNRNARDALARDDPNLSTHHQFREQMRLQSHPHAALRENQAYVGQHGGPSRNAIQTAQMRISEETAASDTSNLGEQPRPDHTLPPPRRLVPLPPSDPAHRAAMALRLIKTQKNMYGRKIAEWQSTHPSLEVPAYVMNQAVEEMDAAHDKFIQEHGGETPEGSGTRRNRLATLNDFTAFTFTWANEHGRNLTDPMDVWNDPALIETCAPMYLVYYVENTKGKDGEPPKAFTLIARHQQLTHSILKCTLDSAGNRVGLRILAQNDLYQTLHNLVVALIREHKLDRHRNKKLFYQTTEVLMILRELLGRSENGVSRFGSLQLGSITLQGFFHALRPSSMGPYSIEYVRLGQYPKCGDVRIYPLGDGRLEIVFDVRNWKGYNIAVGHSTEFSMVSLDDPSLLIFDPTMWFYAMLSARGALPNKFSNPESLFGSDLPAEIEILQEFRDLPLFIAATSRGIVKNLTTSTSPLMATGISHAFSEVCQACGLPCDGAYCLRRGAADIYHAYLGAAKTQLLLNHSPANTVLNRSYSRNTRLEDWVKHVFGAKQGYTKEQEQKILRDSAAIEAMVYLQGKIDGVDEGMKKVLLQNAEDMKTNPQYLAVKREQSRAWVEWRNMIDFPVEESKYLAMNESPKVALVNALSKKVEKGILLMKASSSRARFAELLPEIIALEVKKKRIKQAGGQTATRAEKSRRNADAKSGRRIGTLNERTRYIAQLMDFFDKEKMIQVATEPRLSRHINPLAITGIMSPEDEQALDNDVANLEMEDDDEDSADLTDTFSQNLIRLVILETEKAANAAGKTLPKTLKQHDVFNGVSAELKAREDQADNREIDAYEKRHRERLQNSQRVPGKHSHPTIRINTSDLANPLDRASGAVASGSRPSTSTSSASPNVASSSASITLPSATSSSNTSSTDAPGSNSQSHAPVANMVDLRRSFLARLLQPIYDAKEFRSPITIVDEDGKTRQRFKCRMCDTLVTTVGNLLKHEKTQHTAWKEFERKIVKIAEKSPKREMSCPSGDFSGNRIFDVQAHMVTNSRCPGYATYHEAKRVHQYLMDRTQQSQGIYSSVKPDRFLSDSVEQVMMRYKHQPKAQSVVHRSTEFIAEHLDTIPGKFAAIDAEVEAIINAQSL